MNALITPGGQRSGGYLGAVVTLELMDDPGTAVVPLPAGIVLFGSALGALGLVGRRRRATTG